MDGDEEGNVPVGMEEAKRGLLVETDEDEGGWEATCEDGWG